MHLSSHAFQNNNSIPKKYTCQGEGINPPLSIMDIPSKAKTLVLLLEDPDTPGGYFLHWAVFDIPVINEIVENSTPGKLAFNDGGQIEYTPPCPPTGTHRYIFTVFAVDIFINKPDGIAVKEIKKTIEGHVLASDKLVGLYKKS